MSNICNFQHVLSGAAIVLACTFLFPLTAHCTTFDIASEYAYFQAEEKIVSIASKRAQPLAEAPSAVSVITADDIRESGAKSLADVLGRVPGMDINYSTGSTFAVSTRGYSAEKASHMLVLLDGVSQYTTLYGGTRWDALPVRLEEIERIEIIRGSGGVLYGANAINGVINIITTSPVEQNRQRVSQRFGNRGFWDSSFGLVTDIGPDFTVSFSGGYQEYRGYGGDDGREYEDRFQMPTASLKADWSLADGVEVQFVYRRHDGELDIPYSGEPYTIDSSGNQTSLRYEQTFDSGSTFSVSSYYLTRKRDPQDTNHFEVAEDERIFDIETQFTTSLNLIRPQMFTLGGGWRQNKIDMGMLENNSGELTIWNLFLHDELRLHKNLALTLGAKLENNSYTDNEYHGQAALVYQVYPGHYLRGLISRAVKMPTMLDYGHEHHFFGGPQMGLTNVHGNHDIGTEVLISRELGYRAFLGENWEANLELYYNDLQDEINLVVTEYTPGIPFPQTTYGVQNGGDATLKGIELSFDGSLFPWWNITLSGTWQEITPEGDVIAERWFKYPYPSYKVDFDNRFHWKNGLYCDLFLGYTSSVDETATVTHPEEWRLDGSVGKQFRLGDQNFEVAVSALNIFNEGYATNHLGLSDPNKVGSVYICTLRWEY